MPRLIDLHGNELANDWQIVAKECSLPDALAMDSGKVLLPLALWQAHKQEVLARGKAVAVWLDSNEQASAIADDLPSLPLVALNFPAFMDGRAYSTATNLRQHYGYAGEIRAIGDVLRDQLFLMRRCGFTTFDLRDSVKLEDARKALQDFKDSYQSTIEEPLPLFRRRA